MKSNLVNRARMIGCCAVVGLAGGLLSACGSGSSSGSKPNPPPSTNSFTAFVKQQLQKPGTAEPAVVNGVTFDFTDLNNPDAYNDVLPPPSSTGG